MKPVQAAVGPVNSGSVGHVATLTEKNLESFSGAKNFKGESFGSKDLTNPF